MPDLPQLKDSEFTLSERVGVLTFKRDDVRNALSGTGLTDDLVTTLTWANSCPDISVLIITGEGKAFSAGGNIKTMSDRAKSPPHVLQQNYKLTIQRIPRAFADVEIPVIAAVNGPAIGAGFDLVNMCDLRFGSTDAQFGETFVNLGIIAGDGGAWFLQRVVGNQRAAELTLSGRLVKAEEAKALGILLEVTAPEQLLPQVHEVAAKIAAKPPLAVRYAKQLLRLAQQQPLREHLEVCASFQALCHKTEDHAEAMAAFFEKRGGVFHGR